jgi:hypothetical protein
MAENKLHLVLGGEVSDPTGADFIDADNLDVVGVFSSYDKALAAWKGASHTHVDEAHNKYVIVHLHRMLDPDNPQPEFKERRQDR